MTIPSIKGCLVGVHRFFDRHRRFRVRRMLSNASVLSTGSSARLIGMGNTSLDRELNVPVQDNIKAQRRNSYKRRIFGLISKVIGWKQKTQTTPQRLQRTFSIHHSEWRKNVPPSELTSKNSSNNVGGDPGEVVSVQSHTCVSGSIRDSSTCQICRAMDVSNQSAVEHLTDPSAKQDALRTLLKEAKETLEKQNVMAHKQSEENTTPELVEFLNSLGFEDTDKKIILGIVGDSELAGYPGFSISKDKSLAKGSSFPIAHGLRKYQSLNLLKSKERLELLRQSQCNIAKVNPPEYAGQSDLTNGRAAETSVAVVDGNNYFPEPPMESKHESAEKRYDSIIQRIEHAIDRARKEQLRIMMDGVLHKIPSGQNLSAQDVNRRFSRSFSTGYDTNTPKENESTFSIVHSWRHMRRSQSLSDSLSQFHVKSFSRNRNSSHLFNQSIDEETEFLDEVLPLAPSGNVLDEVLETDDIQENGVDDSSDEEEDVQQCVFTSDNDQTTDFKLNKDSGISNFGFLSEEDQSSKPAPAAKATEFEGFVQNEMEHLEDVKDSSNTDMLQCTVSVNMLPDQVDVNGRPKADHAKSISSKYPFSYEEFFKAWYYLNQGPQAELDGQPNDTDLLSLLSTEISPDQELLFDLINEVYYELHEMHSVDSPWLSERKLLHTSRALLECRVLDEVRRRFIWLLELQEPSHETASDYVALDLFNDDRWLCLRNSIEHVGMELELQMLDDLLGELIYDVGGARNLSSLKILLPAP